MSNYSDVARSILGKVDRDVLPIVKKNSQCADEFQKKVHQALPRATRESVVVVSFIHYGSAYEGLAVDEKADFDIAVILERSFESDNFEVTPDPPTGHFTLQWKSHLPDKPYSDGNGYLDAKTLRGYVCNGILQVVDGVRNQIPDAVIQCEELQPNSSALKVQIVYNTGRTVLVDLVPQIVFRTWGQCPDLKPLQDLPKTLRCYIDTLNKNKSPIMFMTLNGYVDRNQYCPNRDLIVSASFALLEKKFLTSNVELRDMVRLVKLVAKKGQWKKPPKWWFLPVYAKRLAVRYCEELKGKTLWEGYKAILRYLSEEVKRGYFDGYFINGQVLYKWDSKQQDEFLRDIAIALEMHPSGLDPST